jgi:hypothetical protein
MSLRITKELMDYLTRLITLSPSDLKLKDYDRGFKAGQLEVVEKLRVLYEKESKHGR